MHSDSDDSSWDSPSEAAKPKKSVNNKGQPQQQQGQPKPVAAVRKQQADSINNPPPPYDFKPALPDSDSKVSNTKLQSESQPPGKSKKGAMYDPTTRQGSWDDSEAEEKTLAALRQSQQQPVPGAGGSVLQQQQQQPAAAGQSARLTTSADTKSDTKPKMATGANMKQLPWKGGAKSNGQGEPAAAPASGGRSTTDPRDIDATFSSGGGGGGQPPPLYQQDTSSASAAAVAGIDLQNKYVHVFDHGHPEYLETKPAPVYIKMETYADKLESAGRSCWMELFTSARIPFDFLILLLVELMRFVVRDIAGKLLVGALHIYGEFLLKPVLAATFNSCVQPLLLLLANCGRLLQRALHPGIQIAASVAEVLAIPVRAFRLIDYNHYHPHQGNGSGNGKGVQPV